MINHLPPGNALQRAADPEVAGRGWTLSDTMLWELVQTMHTFYTQYINANTDKRHRQPPPPHRPYPWSEVEDPANTSYGYVAEEDREAAVNYLLSL